MARPKKQALETFLDTESIVNTENPSEPTQQAVEPSTSTQTISVADACAQLAMPEQMLRLALQPSHPEDFDILKELPLNEFAIIAETLQRKALNSSESPHIPSQPSQELKEEAAITSSQTSVPTQQRLKLEAGTVNALTQFTSEYVITLDKITSALAYTTSKASLDNFVQIHSGVFRSGLEDYLEEFAEEMTTAAHVISQVKASDFLSNRGIFPKKRQASNAISEILNLANR